ncbi:MAG: DNA polymerase IV [Chloroflexi bacterium]|nr:MAG: DNA polymerase IV [Chloroflexota bacterium]
MARKILHLDLDAFYCAVEEQRNPGLHGKPFAVGGRPDQRGVVASCSYAARKFGVHSAMPMAQAMRRCPNLIVVPGNHRAYSRVSGQVMARLHNLTPLVEQLSIDEAFLDVSDLPDSPENIARALQADIRRELGLPCSIGAAGNKLVAKIANNIGKASAQVRPGQTPNAITVVPPGQEAEFLAPLPVRELWGVGPKTAEKLESLGLHTIGDVAGWPESDLIRRFGKHGADLSRRAKGVDNRPVITEHEAKSVSQERTFATDISGGTQLRRTLRSLCEMTGRRLRKRGLSGTTVRLKIRWADFTTLTRQTTLGHPTNLDAEIYAAALELFNNVWPEGKRVRLLGVGVSHFESPGRQLSLWDSGPPPDAPLQKTLDDIRERFGSNAVKRGSQLEQDDE